jgi:hypothetical protein
MRWPWIACLLLASLLSVSAEEWNTEDGHVYHNVTVVGQEDDGVRITYDGGVGKIPYYELSDDLQKRFGQDVATLAVKRQAVEKAVADAVKSAAESQVTAPLTPAYVPGTAPTYAPTGPSPENPTPGTIPGTANTAPGATAPGTTAPGTTAPGATAPGTTANPNSATGPAATTAKPGQTPGTAANTAPGAHNPSAHPGTPGGTATAGGQTEEMPTLMEPISHTPQPAGISAAGGKPLSLTVANYSYNGPLDVCYLDSPPIDVAPARIGQSSAAPPVPGGQASSLTLRMITEGTTPQQQDRYEATFLAVGGDGGDISTRAIVFSTNTGAISVEDADRKDSGSVPGSAQPVQYASFYLTSAQVRQICDGRPQTFSVGPTVYQIDARSAEILRSYVSDVETLQPASSSLMHSIYKLLARIPSFFTMISTVCEYVILGSFGLLVAFSIAAFILGISRFIKM